QTPEQLLQPGGEVLSQFRRLSSRQQGGKLGRQVRQLLGGAGLQADQAGHPIAGQGQILRTQTALVNQENRTSAAGSAPCREGRLRIGLARSVAAVQERLPL